MRAGLIVSVAAIFCIASVFAVAQTPKDTTSSPSQTSSPSLLASPSQTSTLSPSANQTQSSIVRGRITDRLTALPLRGITVRIEGTRLGAVTNAKGQFEIINVPLGRIVVAASSVGYEPATATLIIKSNDRRDVVLTMLESALRTAEVIVSASKRVQAVQDVPISVSVVDGLDVTGRGQTSLDQALRYVSGVNVARDQVNIRGASGFAFGVGSRTAVLLDGFPLLSGDNGDIKFDVLPVADIDRIEIIKGAGSALYGTGALGGVVSLITKAPTDSAQVYARVYGGLYTLPRYEQWRYRTTMPLFAGADARYAQTFGDVSANVSVGIRSDESYRNYDEGNRGYAYTKLAWKASDRISLSGFAFGAIDDKQNFIYWDSLRTATSPQDGTDFNERLRSTKLAAGIEYSQLISNATSLVIRPSMFRTRFENRNLGIVEDSTQSTAYSYNVEAQVTSLLTSSFILTTGVVGRLNFVRADVYGKQYQTVFSAFAQGEWTITDGLIATLGARVDREETFTLPRQIEVSPKAGLSWHVTENTTVRGSAGRGFRAATIAERYANIRFGAFQVSPNPEIRPESSWSGELGIHHTAGQWLIPFEFDLAVFDNELYDLIEPTFDLTSPSAPIVFKNVTRARILGAEATLRTMLTSTLGIDLGVTAMLPRDLVLDAPLPYRNNILFYARAAWSVWPFLELQADYRFQNRIERIDDRLGLFIAQADERVPIHALDARIIFNAAKLNIAPIKISLIGRNLTDYYYTEIPANLAPTRSVMVQIEYR